ncbi:S-type pyocin domain-containing protein [Vibrio campbellii]|uniref:T6SS effector antibacterial DNase n=1 Tax=Vibrio campbellii TaxID=680 RepID=UPI001D171C94|nr:S-type pyocin domain-containing protein [Vibrio campbellii]MCC4224497.1 S-type pyocin domain-containing protein [Vibrio campbellii]
MSYKTLPLSEVMSHEFGLIEGDFHNLAEADIASAIPANLTFEQLKQHLYEGKLILVSDRPQTPALLSYNDPIGSKTWRLNSEVISAFSDDAAEELLAKTKIPRATGGYSARIGDTATLERAYTPQPIAVESEEEITKEFEYSFEVGCSDATIKKMVCCNFALAKTEKENAVTRWEQANTEQGTRYTALCVFDEPKRLNIHIADDNLGLTPLEAVTLQKAGSHKTEEGFIPVVPAVRLGERLGLPTEGYYYHFNDGELVQEYKILGQEKWAFYATRSTQDTLNDERGFTKDQSAILVYWKLANQVLENQYIIYLERQITREELDNLSEDWLSENGIKLDIPALFDAAKQPEEARVEDNNDETEAEQTAATHIVVAGETWQSIAERYGMGAKALLSLNPVFEADPLSLAIGDEIVVAEVLQQQAPDKKNTFPPLRPQTYNNIRNSHYQHSDALLWLTTHRAINAADFVESDVAILNLKDATSSLVFAKSCTRPEGCIEIGDQQESISNFGPWSFFFAQANATPAAFIPAIQATQAQMAMGSSAAVAGSPEQTQQTQTAAMQLDKLAGTLKDKIVEGYRWQVEGIGALFAMQQNLFGDNTQYTDQDLRQVTTAQSRVRVHITEPKDGEFYPHVQGYHIDDTRIPIKYVKQGNNGQLSVAIEKNGPSIYWTPEENGEASWQSTPDHSDGFEKDDILVTPIHSDGDANVTVTPAPEEKDWRDAILVFPESSGIAPLYVVYKESPRDKPGVVTGKGEDIFGIWLAGAGKDLGAPIPSQIADKLRGKEFSNFDAFRKAFWIEVSKDSVLMAQFNRTNQKKISSGKSPIAPKGEHYGKMIRYEIHHQHEISKGGAVFHVDNLAVVTPKHHKRIHFGKN